MTKLLMVVSICAFLVLLAMINFTSPTSIGPVGVLLFFTTTYLFFLGLAVVCCRLFFMLRGKMIKAKGSSNNEKKSVRYGFVLALMPVILMLIGSFGTITISEVMLTIMLEILLCFLTSRNVI